MRNALQVEPLTDEQKAKIKDLYHNHAISAQNLKDSFLIQDMTTLINILKQK